MIIEYINVFIKSNDFDSDNSCHLTRVVVILSEKEELK